MNISISDIIHKSVINKKLAGNKLFIAGMIEFIYPNLYVRYSGLTNAVNVKNTITTRTPNFLLFSELLKYSNPVLTANNNPRYNKRNCITFNVAGIFP